MKDPDETFPEERPADETSREEASAPDRDRETSETNFDWSPHPSISELPEVGDDADPSYGRIRDRLLGNRPFQFSMATMFWITAAVAIVFSSASASGKPYGECLVELFLWIYIPIYIVGPAVIAVVSSWAKTPERRLLVGGVTTAVIIVPGLILAGYRGSSEGILAVLFATVFIWGFESLVIMGIWQRFAWTTKSQSRTKDLRKHDKAPEILRERIADPGEPITDFPEANGKSEKPPGEPLPTESDEAEPDETTGNLPRIVDPSPAMDKLLRSGRSRNSSQPLTSPLQFSLWNLLVLTAAVAILFSFAKASGGGFGSFFLSLYFLVCFCGPYIIFLVAASWPRVKHENRKWIGTVAGLLILGSMAVVTEYSVVTEGMPIDAILLGIGLLLLVWGPQVLVLWMVFHWHPIRRAYKKPLDHAPHTSQEQSSLGCKVGAEQQE